MYRRVREVSVSGDSTVGIPELSFPSLVVNNSC